MMGMRVISAALLMCLGSIAAAQSDDPDIRLGARIGPGELRINANEMIGDERVDSLQAEDMIGIGGTFEYRPFRGLVLEAGLLTAGSTDWFDSEEYQFTEYFGSVGYEFQFGNGFSVIPRVGRARWKLEADDNWFFEEEEVNPATLRGYQNYWEITGMKRLNERISLGISHKENHHDFGRVRSTVFMAMFDL
jgi:hypothetical protein